jgi:hypothetical protein
MTHEDAGHYAAKHSPDRKPDEALLERIRGACKDNRITCAAAHKIADEQKVSPSEVGFTIDFLEARINRCQLGLFGYSPQRRIVKAAETISDELERAIRDELVDNRLSCARAWDIADRMSISRMDVASACERLNIKISQCQLGAF